jgi:hypothetical protein
VRTQTLAHVSNVLEKGVRLTLNQRVPGSSPGAPTNDRTRFSSFQLDQPRAVGSLVSLSSFLIALSPSAGSRARCVEDRALALQREPGDGPALRFGCADDGERYSQTICLHDNARHPMNVNFSLNGERNGACSGRGTQSVPQNVSPVRKTSIA